MSLKLIFRTLFKDRFYTFLNIVGLAVGIAVAILTFLYIQSELTYDLHYADHDRIYRVGTRFIRTTEVDEYALSGEGMSELIQMEYPEIEVATDITFRSQRILFRHGEKAFYLDDVLSADSLVFDIFNHEFIWGDPNTAMDGPNKLVLKASVAERFFGDQDPIGKTVDVNDRTLEVTGVFKDHPQNTHFKYSGLISRGFDPEAAQRSVGQRLWGIGRYSYIKLQESNSIEDIKAKLNTFSEKYSNSEGADQFVMKPVFESLADIHFQSKLPYDQPHGNMNYIYAFFIIGCLILLLATINYINLTTARASNRAKEVGIKKVVGVSRKELIFYFLGESFVITTLAALLALGLVEFLFKVVGINQLLNKDLALNLLSNPTLLIGIVVLTIALSFFAGIYPAFYLSGLKPIGTLKGSFKTSSAGLFLRRVLVVSQFVISIGVVTLTILMIQQIDFLRNKDLGFKKENLMTIPLSSQKLQEKLPEISKALLSNADVLNVSAANQVPGVKTDRMNQEVEVEDGFKGETFSYLVVGFDYLKTMNMEVTAGRGFDRERGTDEDEAWMVNEAFVKKHGWTDPIGKRIVETEDSLGVRTYRKVIGVVKNFSISSLHEEVHPTALFVTEEALQFLHVRIADQNVPKTIAWVQNQWSSVFPNTLMDFKFMDDTFDALYNEDERQSRLLSFLSILCAIISCLGLLGLTSFTTQQRTKEMGVRKVLGASIGNIVGLLFKEVFRIVFLSALIAIPLTYWAYQNWSMSFAYQQSISYLLFPMVILLALLVASLTISFHSLRLARSNPIGALRME